MTEPRNTGPKDPATNLEIQAQGLRDTISARALRIIELNREIGRLIADNDRDEVFANQYDAAASQLRNGGDIHVFFMDLGAGPGDVAGAA